MGMDRDQMDQVLNTHYMYEATDDVEGVLSTLTEDVQHSVAGSPTGPLSGTDAVRPFYVQLFKDLRGEGVEPVARWYGDNFVVDEVIWSGRIEDGRLLGLEGRSGQVNMRLLHVLEFRDGKISRENVWCDTAAVIAQTQLVANA
jgi:ketosteroid isomerase-like protein